MAITVLENPVVSCDEGVPDAGEDELTALPALDYDSAVELGAQISAGAARVAAVTAAWVEMVGVFDARRGPDGLRSDMSTAQWLAYACSMSSGTAREHVRIARALRTMPLVADAFGRGALSFSKVRECTRLVGVIDEGTLVECARNWTAAQLERAVRGYRAGRTSRLVLEKTRALSLRHQRGWVGDSERGVSG
ncbi:MAG: DUF222 domain-containing protein [Cumulibacter sp.]